MPQATRYRRRRKEKPLGRAKSCRWQVFVRRRPPKGCRWGRRKDLIGLARSRHCSELNRGLQNLDSPFGKGFNFVSGKLLFECADSRFVKPRISFCEGFNFVSAKLLFGWVDSRFAKPQCSLQGERFYSFRLYEKNQKYPKGCGPLDSRGRFKSPLDSWVSLK